MIDEMLEHFERCWRHRLSGILFLRSIGEKWFAVREFLWIVGAVSPPPLVLPLPDFIAKRHCRSSAGADAVVVLYGTAESLQCLQRIGHKSACHGLSHCWLLGPVRAVSRFISG
jgi:hypothetical protein